MLFFPGRDEPGIWQLLNVCRRLPTENGLPTANTKGSKTLEKYLATYGSEKESILPKISASV